ncbi:MAG: glutamate-5-semialdehyde dehydrogenase [bacterium]|nr:glutamate-5-semialdehyde dehydrogenase [bacterium]
MNYINTNKITTAFLELSNKSEKDKNDFLLFLSKILRKKETDIISANNKDLKEARKNHLSEAYIQRLTLDKSGIKKIIEKVLEVRELKSGIGEIIEEKIRKDGLKLQKIRVAIGTILIIYEARPEVTIDVASLCIKSGNIAILKGGSEALHTNRILYECILEALSQVNFSKEIITLIDSKDRKIINSLIKRNDIIDLIIARGGYKMVRYIQDNSSIPVLAHSSGGARIYIDKSADLSIVETIIINSKITKPSACNSLDTILIHNEIKDDIYHMLINSLKEHNVKVVKDVWDEEFLDLKLSIKIVNNEYEAIDFINTYGKKHTEGIIAENAKTIHKFIQSIDTAAICVNCSTRLHDGYEFGLGSEMGTATGKLHARGPVGLKELSIYKWIAYGKGHVRK